MADWPFVTEYKLRMAGSMTRAAWPPSIVADNDPQPRHPRRKVGRSQLLKVGQVDATSRDAALRPCLGPPQTIAGERLHQVAQARLRPELRRQAGQAIGTAARAHVTTDSHYDIGVEREAITIVHQTMFLFRSSGVKEGGRANGAARSDSRRMATAARAAERRPAVCVDRGMSEQRAGSAMRLPAKMQKIKIGAFLLLSAATNLVFSMA